jgi:hypothetical protein
VRSPLVATAVLVVVLVMSGVGFACGDGGSGCHGDRDDHCRSSPQIEWVAPVSTGAVGGAVGCAVSFTPSVVTWDLSFLVPGAGCSLEGTIENVGTSPTTLSEDVHAFEPASCRLFTYTDNLLGASPSPLLPPGHTFTYQAELSLSASAGNACEHAAATFEVTISPGEGYTCEGFQYGFGWGSDGEGDCCH